MDAAVLDLDKVERARNDFGVIPRAILILNNNEEYRDLYTADLLELCE